MADPGPSLKVRMPPHSYEAEESVIGSVLIDKDAIIRIADFLVGGDFYKEAHRKIYDTCVELYEKGDPIEKPFAPETHTEREEPGNKSERE